MISPKFKTFVAEKCRPAIAEAADTILTRIKNGWCPTSIVIPPRVGKSNLMRAVAIEAMETGLVGAVVCLVPWVFLAEQLNQPSKIRQMQIHHGMTDADTQLRAIVKDTLSGSIDPRFFQQSPRRHWWTMTMGQAQQDTTKAILASAARYFLQEERRPLLVFIDECQFTSSGREGWGKIAAELQDAGAHLVLLTGTPERSDDIAPFGFRKKIVSRDTIEFENVIRIDDEHIRIDKKAADEIAYEIDADFEMPLKAAWTQNIITRIYPEVFTFSVNGDDVKTMSKHKSHRALATALRDPVVVSRGVDIMLKTLKNRRDNAAGRNTAAIVFVGSDREEDDETNFECRQVKRTIEAQWSNHFPNAGRPDVKIATMKDDEGRDCSKKARDIIQRFVGDDDNVGVGDIIIVKQMGSVGLDAARMKIALDLSTVRTKGNTIQRWLRVATKADDVETAVLILPDDVGTLNLYNQIVKDGGGDQKTYENLRVIDTKVVDAPITPPSPPESTIIDNVRRNGSFDMDGRYVDPNEDNLVDMAFSRFPLLALRLSRRETMDFILTWGKPENDPTEQGIAFETQTAIFDTEKEVETRCKTINSYCKELANRTSLYIPNTNNEKWQSTFKRHMADTKNYAGILSKLEECRDIDKLTRAVEFLEIKRRSA